MEKYKRKSIFESLNDYCVFSEDSAYIEVTEWKNGEGVDVDISGKKPQIIQLTYGQLRLLNKLVKKLTKPNDT